MENIIEYKEATCIGGFKRKGTHRIMIPLSGVIREFRDITLFEIDGLSVYNEIIYNFVAELITLIYQNYGRKEI